MTDVPWKEVGNSYPACERILIRGGIDGIPAGGGAAVLHDATLTGDGTITTPLGVVEALTLGTLLGFGSLTVKRDTWNGSATSIVSQATNALSSRSVLSFRDSLAAVKWTVDSDYNGARSFRIRDNVGSRDILQANQLAASFISFGASNGGFSYTDTTQQMDWFVGGFNYMSLLPATGFRVDAALTVTGAMAHQGILAGFFNAAPVAKPIVVGSRALGFGVGGAGLSLLAALVALGLVTDATVA